MSPRLPRFLLPAVAVAVLLVGIFAATVLKYRQLLREEIHRTIIGRDAAALWPVALQQLAEREAQDDSKPADLLGAVLQSSQQQNMLAVAVFNVEGRTLQYAPDSLLFPELPLDDYLHLMKGEPISRFNPAFALNQYFYGFNPTSPEHLAPVLEVLLPLHGRDPKNILGFVQYYIDARALQRELAGIDLRIRNQTIVTLAIGAGLILLVVSIAFLLLRRAQLAIAERNERLMRANFELTLAAKASALGQITSHLVHGLQGPVAGLRAVMNSRGAEGDAPDWQSAADYTDRLQAIIGEAVGMLSDVGANASYDLTADEIAQTIRARNDPAAIDRAVKLTVKASGEFPVDSHRGGLVCLIAANLIQNAIHALKAGGAVQVHFACSDSSLTLEIQDNGPGIPEALREQLFRPGRSGRPGGTGLGLAISQLLARQLGAELSLVHTGPDGTLFRLSGPRTAPADE